MTTSNFVSSKGYNYRTVETLLYGRKITLKVVDDPEFRIMYMNTVPAPRGSKYIPPKKPRKKNPRKKRK